MAFRINDMITKLSGGGARNARFRVILAQRDSQVASLAPFMIQASSIPSSTIAPIEVPYFGRRIKVAGDREFENWAVEVINDENFIIRHYMEQWHNNINHLSLNRTLYPTSNPREYKMDAEVQQMSSTDENTPIRVYRFKNIFPINISAIELNWDAQNQIERFNVTFAYDWYEVLPVGASAQGGVGLTGVGGTTPRRI